MSKKDIFKAFTDLFGEDVMNAVDTSVTIENQLIDEGAVVALEALAKSWTTGQFRDEADARYCAGLLALRAGIAMMSEGAALRNPVEQSCCKYCNERTISEATTIAAKNVVEMVLTNRALKRFPELKDKMGK